MPTDLHNYKTNNHRCYALPLCFLGSPKRICAPSTVVGVIYVNSKPLLINWTTMAKLAQPRTSSHSALKGYKSLSLRERGWPFTPPITSNRFTAYPNLSLVLLTGATTMTPQLTFWFPSLSPWVILAKLSNSLLSLQCFQVKVNFVPLPFS